jgi:hypothetical protein
MDRCAQYIGYPNCWGVVFSVGDNACYLKHSGVGSKPNPGATTSDNSVLGVAHTSQLKKPLEEPLCPSAKSMTSTGSDTTFEIDCSQNLLSRNLGAVHVDSLQECLDACAKYDGEEECTEAYYEHSMEFGYTNCMLKTGSSENNPVIIKAVASRAAKTTSEPIPPSNTFSGTPTGKSDTPSEQSRSTSRASGSSDLAWIAGMVVGSVAIIAILLGLVLYWRRRSQNRRQKDKPPPKEPFEAPPTAPYPNYVAEKYLYEPSETHSSHVVEADGQCEYARNHPTSLNAHTRSIHMGRTGRG